MANALAACSSPYLRQHADNPVAWVPWSDAAFAEARRRNVPVLVSIGYSTCHWCHVMAHESFEDPATAAAMNAAFVCIKVDREEHPEVDAIYMDAVQALTGHGGWPLNAVTDHQGRPFYACTYLPRGQWTGLLGHLDRLWREDPAKIARAAAEITTHLLQEEAPRVPGDLPVDIAARLVQQVERAFDRQDPGLAWGGGRAPKFPPSQLLNLVFGCARAGEPLSALVANAEAILEAMQDGGIHDRVGGGFHRYSVDPAWRLPHFEKMLYDNTQLIRAFALAGAQRGRADFLRTAVNAGDYLLRDLRLTAEDGAFLGYAAAEDADDPGGEGSFYAWSPQQVTEVLGPEIAAGLIADWDLAPGKPEVGPHGHLDPVLSHIPQPRAAATPPDQARRAAWETHLPALRQARDRRPRPGRDDKVLTDQNGLALEAFAWLGRLAPAMDRPRFQAATRELADLICTRHQADGLLRLPGRLAVVTDYGSACTGLLAAFDLLGDPALVHAAAAIADEAVARLRADDGGFHTAPAGRTDLIRRGREDLDNAWPGGQSSLALAFVRLAHLTGGERWTHLAEGVFQAAAASVSQAPAASSTLLAAWWSAQAGPLTTVVAGDPDDPRRAALLEVLRSRPDPQCLIVPLAECRTQSWACLDGRIHLTEHQVLLCRGTRCSLPATTPGELLDRLEG